MPPNKMTLKDLENFLSTPRIGGGLSKASSALRRAEEERQAQRSVFNQPREPEWQPDYVRPGGHALEAPMISPDDLIGTGIPTKLAMMLKGAAPLAGGLGVIKNKGGNWLNGSVEGALSGLKKGADAPTLNGLRDRLSQRLTDLGLDPARIASLSNDEVLRQASALAEYKNLPVRMMRIQTPIETSLNSFIDKQLTRYVKNDMATPEDPIRALAEQGVLHVDPAQLRRGSYTVHPSGNEYQKLAQNPDAAKWETAADHTITEAPYRDHLPLQGEAGNEPTGALRRLGGDFAVANPDASAFGWNRGTSTYDLGFDHLTDELANALNPDSGLPRHLLLDPKSMDRVSVPQAVERVSQINAWRAAQKAEADAIRANNAATVLHKEYPDKGMKWVELRQPEAKTFEDLTPQQQEWYRDYLAEGVSPEGAVRNAAKRGTALADALKYEGDTMGHCVGGYCDDVASGRSRIYSLRDAKGQPHVTVEVAGPQGFAGKKSREEYEAFLRGHETPHSEEEIAQALQDLDKGGAWSPRIKQIKGKQNRAPNEEYLPFVQDFVKSGKWSDVGDLGNTGLQRAGWAPDVLERMKAAGIEAPEYGTADEINAALNALNKARGFANGGPVNKNPLSVQQLQAIIAQIRQEHINA